MTHKAKWDPRQQCLKTALPDAMVHLHVLPTVNSPWRVACSKRHLSYTSCCSISTSTFVIKSDPFSIFGTFGNLFSFLYVYFRSTDRRVCDHGLFFP